MLDREKKFYEVGNEDEVDRQNYKIDLNKPYIIVCGDRGIGKSVYINVMRKFNSEIQYLELQSLNNIYTFVINNALKIISIMEVTI